MSWTLFKVNVLKSMVSFQFGKDMDAFAEFYANEYHSCIQRGGDMLYGVPVMNGNVQGMIDAIKTALFRGFTSDIKLYPIIRNLDIEKENKSYFDNFFKPNGRYLNFIEYTQDDLVEYAEIYRRKKKFATNIIILRDNLIKEMQNQKIIKLLDNGF